MIIILLADIAKLILLEDSDSFFNRPITTIGILILVLIGLLIDNEFFYGIGIAAILPSFVLAIDNIINQNEIFYLNVTVCMIGCAIFIEKQMSKWWYILIDAAIYEYLIFLPEFRLSVSFLEMFNQFFITYFYSMVFIGAFLMAIFEYFKDLEANTKHSRPDLMIPPKTKAEKAIDRIKYPLLHKYFVLLLYLFGVFIGVMVKYILNHTFRYAFTISLWSFVAAILVIFFNNKYLSSLIVAIAPPIVYLMIFDVQMSMGLLWVIGNAVYHGIIVLMAAYVFIKKRTAQWDWIFVFGIILKILAYMLNYFYPGYIVNLEEFMYLVFMDTVITTIIYFYLTIKHPKMYQEMEIYENIE